MVDVPAEHPTAENREPLDKLPNDPDAAVRVAAEATRAAIESLRATPPGEPAACNDPGGRTIK